MDSPVPGVWVLPDGGHALDLPSRPACRPVVAAAMTVRLARVDRQRRRVPTSARKLRRSILGGLLMAALLGPALGPLARAVAAPARTDGCPCCRLAGGRCDCPMCRRAAEPGATCRCAVRDTSPAVADSAYPQTIAIVPSIVSPAWLPEDAGAFAVYGRRTLDFARIPATPPPKA